MLRFILSIGLITLISSSSYTLNDLIPYYSFNIGETYSHDANMIEFKKADSFSLITNTATGGSDLHFKIHVEAGSFDNKEKVTLNAYVVRFT
jgi:hypothetical protein